MRLMSCRWGSWRAGTQTPPREEDPQPAQPIYASEEEKTPRTTDNQDTTCGVTEVSAVFVL